MAMEASRLSSDFSETPYWWESWRPHDALMSEVPSATDIAIVGAGYAGLSCALELAKSGVHVTVLEAEYPGSGASTLSGGQVSGGINVGKSMSGSRGGASLAAHKQRLLAEAADSYTVFERILSDNGIDCDYRKAGRINAFWIESHIDVWRQRIEALNRHAQADVRLLSKDELRAELATDIYAGGALVGRAGQLHPSRMLGGMLDAARRAGATVCSLARVTELSRYAGGYKLATARGVLTCREVVICTNGYTDELIPELRRAIVPVVSHQVGPNEVTLTLATPNADLPVILATPQMVIVKDGTTDFSKAIGTGPYKLKSFQPGMSTVGVRNDAYWKTGGGPYLDRIELVGIADDTARVNALLSGDVQLINAVNPRAAASVTASPGHEMRETKSGLYTDLILRRDNSISGNPDFVKGMKYLLNRDQIRHAIFRGYSVIANDQPIPPGHRYFNASLAPRPFDPDKAKFHFQKAGVMGTALPPLYATPAANGSVEMAELIQLAAAKIGMNVAVNRVPSDGYWSNHWMKHPMGFGSINPRPSADVLFTQFFKSDAPWNESGWKNPKFDQLLVAARGETDEGKRKQLYGEMQVLVSEEGGIGIPAFISLLDANDKRLQGLQSIPTGAMMGFMFAEYVWWNA